MLGNWDYGDYEGILVAGLGFEPRQADSESAVLPLHNPAVGGEKSFRTVGGGRMQKTLGGVKFFSTRALDFDHLLAQSVCLNRVDGRFMES